MKKVSRVFGLVSLCLSVWFTASAQQGEGWVSIKGTLKNFSNQVEVENMSEFQYLLPSSSERIVVPDANGNFSIRFKVVSANYYRFGRNALYLSPGDNLEVFIDKGNPRAASFKGKGSEANGYLRDTPFPKGGSFIEAGAQIKETPDATIKAIEDLASARKQELTKVKNVSAEFKRLETARIKADIINSLNSGESYGAYKLKLKGDEVKKYSESYKKAIQPKLAFYSKGFIDASLLKLVVYRDIADETIKQGGNLAEVKKIKDYYAASTLVGEMQHISDKQELSAFKTKIAQLQTIVYRNAAQKMLAHLSAFGKGDLAVDFTVVNMDGQQVKLSSLKGKVIYVDLWATWCGPCMEEMPHFEKLKEQYKSNPDVVFVSLSIDDSDAPWKQSVNARKAGGYQWLINRSKLQAYNIVGIPRTLLIDKNFKMVEMNAPMPSSAAALKSIDALLK